VEVYVETGSKRTFVCALDWAGWARAARTEEEALQALVSYGSRYASALEDAAWVTLPADVGDLEVVERLQGDAGTDFGIPSRECSADQRPLTGKDLKTHVAILRAAWAAFDASAKRHEGFALRRGPRGGGRNLDKIVEHVLEAEIAYFNRLGGRFRPESGEPPSRRMVRVRDEALDLVEARANGYEPPKGRRKAPLWSLRYYVRRSAWHALDHAWEIEDRAQPID
jgi:hypothetical protein